MTGAELAQWRRALGWTEVEAAAALGAPTQTYRNWEDGRTKRVPGPVAMLTRYISAFGRLPPIPRGETCPETPFFSPPDA
jgi:DNA-binding transcriptional regulator YiaG